MRHVTPRLRLRFSPMLASPRSVLSFGQLRPYPGHRKVTGALIRRQGVAPMKVSISDRFHRS